MLGTLAPAGARAQGPEQPAAEAPKPAPPSRERFAVGFRLRTLPVQSLSVMKDRRIMATSFAGKAEDLIVSTTSKSPSVGGGVATEIRLAPRYRLTAELLFHRLRYERALDTYSGSDDPATGQDERTHLGIKEVTKGRLWDAPVLLHRRGLTSQGFLSHLWIAGGVALRNISSIRTETEVANPDGSKTKDYGHAQPARRTLLGLVVGVGFRIIDEFNIKVTPEIRYTRWGGVTFASDTTRSPRGQLEIGIGFTR